LVSIDQYRRKRSLDFESREPVAAEFEAVFDEEDAATAVAVFGLSQPPSPGPFTFAVVISSGRLLSVQSQPPRKFIVVSSQLVAPARLSSHDARSGERPLAPAELDELLLLARSAWRTPLRNALGYIVIGSLAAWQGPDLYRSAWWRSLSAAAFASVGAIAIISVLRGISRARRLHLDAQRATVQIEAMPQADFVLERLPVANELWTIDGRPAPWRTASSIRRL
jgi:hypothetical protein